MDKNKCDNNSWKVSVADFRGYMRAKLEDIEVVIKDQKKDLGRVQKDIVKIKEWVAGRKAIQNVRSTVFGFLGGIFTLVVGFILHKLFG